MPVSGVLVVRTGPVGSGGGRSARGVGGVGRRGLLRHGQVHALAGREVDRRGVGAESQHAGRDEGATAGEEADGQPDADQGDQPGDDRVLLRSGSGTMLRVLPRSRGVAESSAIVAEAPQHPKSGGFQAAVHRRAPWVPPGSVEVHSPFMTLGMTIAVDVDVLRQQRLGLAGADGRHVGSRPAAGREDPVSRGRRPVTMPPQWVRVRRGTPRPVSTGRVSPPARAPCGAVHRIPRGLARRWPPPTPPAPTTSSRTMSASRSRTRDRLSPFRPHLSGVAVLSEQ